MASSSGRQHWDATPEPQGLYNPKHERDACGVGAIIQMERKASRQIVEQANIMLCRMQHRGGIGAVESDGDGCGIMMALPDEYFRSLVPNLPPVGKYGVGNIFMPQSEERVQAGLETLQRCANEHDLKVIHIREMPVNNTRLGPYSKSTEPRRPPPPQRPRGRSYRARPLLGPLLAS